MGKFPLDDLGNSACHAHDRIRTLGEKAPCAARLFAPGAVLGAHGDDSPADELHHDDVETRKGPKRFLRPNPARKLSAAKRHAVRAFDFPARVERRRVHEGGRVVAQCLAREDFLS